MSGPSPKFPPFAPALGVFSQDDALYAAAQTGIKIRQSRRATGARRLTG
jgi:hypothetical protein